MRAKATKAKRPRGRPRKRENTALIASLIAVQDAMSRRTYGKIKAFWREHLRSEDVMREQVEIATLIRARCEAIPDRVAEPIMQLAGNPEAIRALLAAEIRQTLQALADELSKAAEGPVTDDRPADGYPKPTRSRTLAAARSQSARLKVELMRLKSLAVER